MSHSRSTLVPFAPFADLPLASATRPGVIVSDRDGVGIATVLARKGKDAALSVRLRESYRIELPQAPSRAAAGELAICGTAPHAWLATLERASNDIAVSLTATIGDLASISDQSDGYAMLRMAGPRLRDTLCKLVPVDLHPRIFRVGDVAVAPAGHIGAILWRLEDQADGSPTFEITVPRSMSGSFWHELSQSAAEFGLQRVRSVPAGESGQGHALVSRAADGATAT